jgi:hypothetical protein
MYSKKMEKLEFQELHRAFHIWVDDLHIALILSNFSYLENYPWEIVCVLHALNTWAPSSLKTYVTWATFRSLDSYCIFRGEYYTPNSAEEEMKSKKVI